MIAKNTYHFHKELLGLALMITKNMYHFHKGLLVLMITKNTFPQGSPGTSTHAQRAPGTSTHDRQERIWC